MDLLLILWLNNVPDPLPSLLPPLLPQDRFSQLEEQFQDERNKEEKKRGRGSSAGTRGAAEKYGSRQGNEAQCKEEAIRLFSVFKRVLNMALSGMVNLLMLVVFAVVLREMFTAVFHGDCVLDGTKGGIALAYQENVHCKIYWNIKRFI